MKKILSSTVIAALLITFTFAAFFRVETILNRKVSANRYGDLIYANSQPDILFVGTSHVMNAVIPVRLWEKYSATSYILCSEYNDIRRNLPMLKLALQYCNPQVVVLDVENYWDRSDPDETFIGFHEFADGFPLNKTKIEATRSLYGDSKETMEILFPIIRYHERWKSLDRGDFRLHGLSSKGHMGYEFSNKVTEVERYPYVDESSAKLYEDTDAPLIGEFIEYCQNRGIRVVITTVPYNAMEQEQEALWGIGEIAKKYDVPYINMVANYDLVDGNQDFMNEGHMNYFGALKVTDYIGSKLSEEGYLSRVEDVQTVSIWEDKTDRFNRMIDDIFEED